MARWLQTNVGHAELLACCRRTRALKVVMLGRWNAGPLSLSLALDVMDAVVCARIPRAAYMLLCARCPHKTSSHADDLPHITRYDTSCTASTGLAPP